MAEGFREILAARAAAFGMALTNAQLEQCVRYNELLLTWNERMNLTALTAPEDVAVKHIVDSLSAYDAPLFARAKSLIDVGTGATAGHSSCDLCAGDRGDIDGCAAKARPLPHGGHRTAWS
ncbi:16S rRNA methyltransferase GidB [Selenomonas sp. oral taxon 137 str. F0430]|nr:16S rRNA methyltransferase GidB [Selenomonas sp. oral taxon 137 str. F0430]